ncbi:MAG: methionine--tRNA ligase [Planctomycetes bacterium]|nr:methionine--tRNA ligase [Planctomycetota bacterium]
MSSKGNDPPAPGGKFYITTAIDYPNSVPHLGHAYEKTVADFYARWHRQQGLDTHLLTGLDEHGEKIQEAAEKAGTTPQAFVDDQAKVFRALCQELEISNDDFIRTSEPRHHRFAAELFARLQARGDVYFGNYEGDYCISCESFYTDSQLQDGKCPIHGRPTERVKEESYFFRLGKYRPWIQEHIRSHPEFIYPEERRNEILSRLDEEVRDLSISRCTFNWGIPVPGDSRHVIYVWFDALSNYISALLSPRNLYERFWPADVHVIGKDIIWFHTVIWPCILHSAGHPLPRQVYVHGFILDREGRKMAKHLGNVVDPLEVARRHGPEVLRYYFLRAFASGLDGKFSLEELIERYHGELGNDLGNLILRVVKLVESKFAGCLAPGGAVEADLDPLPVEEEYARLVERREHHRALEALWAFIRKTNAYLNERAPWKESDSRANARTLYNALEALRGIASLLAPVMPRTAAAVAEQIGIPPAPGSLAAFGQTAYRVVRKGPLFPRLEAPPAAGAGGLPPAAHPQPSGPPAESDPFSWLDLRVGLIEEVKEHPNADSLYVLTVNLGSERRTVCAGLRKHLQPQELERRKVVVLANLKPAKLRGLESRGMILATDRRDGKVAPVDPGQAAVGERVQVSGIAGPAKPAITLKDFEKTPLRMKGGRVVYGEKPLWTSAGEVGCEAADGATVR